MRTMRNLLPSSSASASSPSRFAVVAAVFVVLALLGVRSPVIGVHAKKDRNQPHPNQGLLKPYQPGPFDISLSKQDEQKLSSGQPVMKQTQADKNDPSAGGGAICVQDVHAPKDIVWNEILDLNSYKGKVPKVLTSKNYYDKQTKDCRNFKTKMVIGVMPGYSVREMFNCT